MKIFKANEINLIELREIPFKLEREIQELFEANLSSVMNLTVVKSEFTIKNKRIDTLAYDEQSNAFIIIEYKRDKNISVVDQGFTYLSLMLENKADFIIEYNEKLNKNLNRSDVDWSQTRVAFVSPSFTDNQIQATNFRDIAIELWEIKRYSNDVVAITPIKKSKSAESIKPITQQKAEYKAIADEIIVYTEDEHLQGINEDIVELYEKYRNSILNLDDDIEVVSQKHYVVFKKTKNIVGIKVQKSSLKLTINAKFGTLDDGKGLARDVSNIGHHSTGDYQIQVDDDNNFEYILSLIKQVT